jgi:lysophospholipase L1-like esterase
LIQVGLALAAGAVAAQTVSGRVFEDRDGDGLRDPGEPGVASVVVELFGRRDAGTTFDQTVPTSSDGSFSFSPGSGCYLLLASDPPEWRMSQAREDGFSEGTSGYTYPVGQPRFGKLDHGIASLKAGALRFTAIGDSIAWNWNSCLFPEPFWYSRQVRSRLACAAPGAAVTLDEAAVKGEDTDDLLVDDHDDLNNVFRVIELQPELVTLSMIGNDLLGVEPPDDPTPGETNRAVAEMLDSRQNLQEALSALATEISGADITVNTLYDNLAWNCYIGSTSAFHREWLPIVNRILRDLAWGLARRASVSEVASEFAHENQAGACSGMDNLICRDFLQTDNIHPNNSGYTVIREKQWEAAGGVNLGPKDALGRTLLSNADYGLLRRVRRLLPRTWEVRGGGAVQDPGAALDDSDGGLPARIALGLGGEEFRVAGFPDWFDEAQIVRVVAGVRYRTTGTVTDDFYRVEASVTDQFRPPPGHLYTTTDWNYYTPIVGGGGPNQPPENPDFPAAKLLARPNVGSYREVTATLTKNPTLPPGATDYLWPAVTPEELATTTVRVVAAPVAATPGDAYQVELDAAWLDLYGWEKPRPAEVTGLRVQRLGDGTLVASFESLSGAQRYNLYFGRLQAIRSGGYDHGAGAPAGPDCAAPAEDAGGGRLEIDVAPAQQPAGSSYILVTAHVDDVECPSGTRSDGSEVDRSQSTCR